jgi:hypothetical protein
MATVKIPYYVVKRGRAFWQPTPTMRANGFQPLPLGADGPEAWAKARARNEAWAAFRLGLSDHVPKVRLRGSIGEAWDRYRGLPLWREKAPRTREEWEERAWLPWIEPAFADLAPRGVTLEDMVELREAVREQVSVREAHRVIKVWRAFWKVMAAMKYCDREGDPSKGLANTAAAGRSATWSEGEVVRLAKHAWRRGYRGLAAVIAVAWDSQLSPVDVRTLRAGQSRQDARGVWFALDRTKTGREALGTLQPRAAALVVAYRAGLGIDLTPEAAIFRNRSGRPYSKDTLGDDFRDIREEVFPGDTRQLQDLRRSGAVEALAGEVDPGALSAKMANSIDQSAELQRTYLPNRLAVVRSADKARQLGRKRLRENS